MALLGSTPLGYMQLTNVTTSTTIAAGTGGGATPKGANAVMISPETQAVRYRDDGIAPTATVGMPLAVGATFTYNGNLDNLRFASQSTAAIINLAFYAVRR